MAFGIDTFRTRLDLIRGARLDTFKQWNGGTAGQGSVTGGDPVFAGRHFLGDPFLWGHSEATNASSEQEGNIAATDPSPQHPENLELTVPLIAPIQAPQRTRQQATGERGLLFGRIDAEATCRRVLAGTGAGEFEALLQQVIKIWLAVDPDVAFSVDYWAGWSDAVNTFTFTLSVGGGIGFSRQPFQAGILCRYVPGANGLLGPDPHVVTALADRTHPSLNTRSRGFWADAAVPARPNDALAPNPQIDWTVFEAATMPMLWRLRNGFLQSGGTQAQVPFDIDAVRSVAGTPPATDFMLTTRRWQPSVPTIGGNIGFIVSLQDAANHEINDAAVRCMQSTPLPDLQDNSRSPSTVTGGPVRIIGRYLKTPGHGFSMAVPEARRLSNAGYQIFTVWESFNVAVGGEPTLDQRHEADWGPFANNFRRNIHYFNPAQHAGTEDGNTAFAYCGDVLKQPPHTPVFFAIDFDPLDLPDPSHPHSDTAHPAPVPPAPGWPALPAPAQRRQWIERYFELVRDARDAYAARNPDRYYLIGVYCCGEILRWCYEQGICSAFWQAVSSGHHGSHPPLWPWYHANRWQYQFTGDGHGIGWNCVPGADPDADWGDGGTWNLTDPSPRRLTELEDREIAAIQQDFQQHFGHLLHPAPVPALDLP